MLRRALSVLALVAVAALAALAWLLRPLPPLHAPRYHSAGSYDDALARLADLLARDSLALHEGCGTTALLAGHPTPHAYVLLHGITNCPLQFAALAESLRADGDNVLVPRVDHHGLDDRMTTDLANLRAGELAALVTECTGIARGLGDTVVVCGLSTSGVAAAWAATHLDAVDRAVTIAPAFASRAPAWTAPLITRAAVRTHNFFVWWDDAKEQDLDGPKQCYPRFATRALGECYRLGEDAVAGLGRGGLRAREVDLVTTDTDHAIDNAPARAFAERCRERGARVRTYAFPASARVVHDMVDPVQVGARVDVTYPVLLAMLRGRPLPAR